MKSRQSQDDRNPAKRSPASLSNWSGLVIGALAVGAVIGALFKYTYPSVAINPELGLLFGLIGLIVAWSVLREKSP